MVLSVSKIPRTGINSNVPKLNGSLGLAACIMNRSRKLISANAILFIAAETGIVLILTITAFPQAELAS